MSREERLFNVRSNPNKRTPNASTLVETKKRRNIRNKDRVYKNIWKMRNEDPDSASLFMMIKKFTEKEKMSICDGNRIIECEFPIADDFKYTHKHLKVVTKPNAKKPNINIVAGKPDPMPQYNIIDFSRKKARAIMVMELLKWMCDGKEISQESKAKMKSVFGL